MSIVEGLPAETTATDSESEARSFLLLQLGDELYSIRGDSVREIARWREPLPVPGAPPVLPGIISQRGTVLPVVNTAALLGLAESQPERTTRFVIVAHDEVEMALVVDAVTDIINLSSEELEPVPSGLDPQRARLLQAITRLEDKPVAVLDLAAIITTLRTGA